MANEGRVRVETLYTDPQNGLCLLESFGKVWCRSLWNRVAFKLTPVSSVPHKTELYESFNAWKGVVDMIYTCNTHTHRKYTYNLTQAINTQLLTRGSGYIEPFLPSSVIEPQEKAFGASPVSWTQFRNHLERRMCPRPKDTLASKQTPRPTPLTSRSQATNVEACKV